MAHGGARPGAGRKKGTRNKLTEVQSAKVTRIAGSGELPLEIMVTRMRELWGAGDKDEAVAIAEKCAPYFHPRLAAVEHTGGVTVTHEDALNDLTTIVAEAERLASTEHDGVTH